MKSVPSTIFQPQHYCTGVLVLNSAFLPPKMKHTT